MSKLPLRVRTATPFRPVCTCRPGAALRDRRLPPRERVAGGSEHARDSGIHGGHARRLPTEPARKRRPRQPSSPACLSELRTGTRMRTGTRRGSCAPTASRLRLVAICARTRSKSQGYRTNAISCRLVGRPTAPPPSPSRSPAGRRSAAHCERRLDRSSERVNGLYSTGLGSGRPSSAAMMFSAASRLIAVRASTVADAVCGSRTTFSSSTSPGASSGSCS